MITREVHRSLKKKSREEMTAWLIWYGAENYNEGVKDNTISIFRRLIDDFGFTDEMIQKLQQGKDSDVDAINQRYVKADEMINGLADEGFKSVLKIKGEKE